MTSTTYLLCFVAGVLGILFHIFAIKAPATKERARVANVQFSYMAFFQDELAAIISSFLAVLIYLFILGELITYKPEIQPYIIALSVFVGFTGSSVLISLLGKASDKINVIVDMKTNISDGVVPPPEPPPVV